MRKAFTLPTCKTCQRIFDDLKPESNGCEIIRSMGLAEKDLAEDDYRTLILGEYTFLKRPVFFVGNEVSVGSRKSEVEKARDFLV